MKLVATQPPKPVFVLRADEVPSAKELERWVSEKLSICHQGDEAPIIAAIRAMLKKYGSVRISARPRLLAPLDLSSKGITLRWENSLTISPPE